MTEYEIWLGEFKRLYKGFKGPPSLTYWTLRYLLDLWHEEDTPAMAVEKVRLMAARGTNGDPK
jgi:hypothetical protein